MILNDSVYGEFEVKEPVVAELIASRPLLRLRGIRQHGAFSLVYPEIARITRLEHSIGVMLVLRKLGAGLEEQVAGLLHDVSHTAFSHTIDFAFQDGKNRHEFHERFREKIVMGSEIPAILERHGMKADKILDEHNFQLLETPLPGLCADRVDYFLRDAKAFRIVPGINEKVNFILKHLIARDKAIILDDFSAAKQMAELYLKCSREVWSGILHVSLYRILGDVLRIAMKKGIISEDDLFLTDDMLLKKLKSAGDRKTNEKLRLLSRSSRFVNDRKKYDFVGYPKPRYIDPGFLEGGKILRVSEMDAVFKSDIANFIMEAEAGYHVKLC